MKWRFLVLSILIHSLFLLFLIPRNSLKTVPGRKKASAASGSQISVTLVPQKKIRERSPAKKGRPKPKKPYYKSASKKIPTNSLFANSKTSSKIQKKTWGPNYDILGSRGSTVGGKYSHPKYPKLSRLYNEQGRVRIGIEVINGKITDAKVLVSSGYKRLDDASLSAVKKWHFPKKFSKRFVQPILFEIN